MRYSKDGYKRNSKDRNNPYNIIPSGNITMENVDFPVYGVDNLGNGGIMMPGVNYTFPGNTVLEVPLAQNGEETPEWENSEFINQMLTDIYYPSNFDEVTENDYNEYVKNIEEYNNSLSKRERKKLEKRNELRKPMSYEDYYNEAKDKSKFIAIGECGLDYDN